MDKPPMMVCAFCSKRARSRLATMRKGSNAYTVLALPKEWSVSQQKVVCPAHLGHFVGLDHG